MERDIRIEFARDFKTRAAENSNRLAALIRETVPAVSDAASHQFAGAAFVVTAGL
ncbi:hypothetical protein [Curtobacterium sp. PhB130]|uniref:hypothetical protein n=1 Tax=Curtobacterium sp. PhB130 TaxID=2485178 RepID=UPI001615B8F0|nr:hypothetical protein [Curtobacterium sp. PhB130]